MLLCPLLLALLFVLSSHPSSTAADDNSEDGLARMLSSLWRMDSEHRRFFREEFRLVSGEGGGHLDAVFPRPSLLSRPIGVAFGKLCNVLESVGPNQSKGRKRVRKEVESFLAKLGQSPIFKRASEFYSARSLSDAKSFREEIRALWFFPPSDLPFHRLLCRFSAFSGNWISFILQQRRRDMKQHIELRRVSENMALVEFGARGHNGGGHVEAEKAEAEKQQLRRHFPLGDSVEFELCAVTLCALSSREQRRLQRAQRCTFALKDEEDEQQQMELRTEVRTTPEGLGDTQRHLPFLVAFSFEPSSSRRESPSFPPISVGDFSSAFPVKRDDGRRDDGFGTVAARKRVKLTSRNRTMGHSKSMPSLRGPANIQQLVDRMWEQDSDRVDESVLQVNWQQHIPHKSVQDVSASPFLNVTDDSFLQWPIYAALVDIYNEQLFHPPVCQGEPSMDAQRRAKFDKLWALITRSSIYRTAYDYLDSLGKVDGLDFDAFTRQLFDRWFGSYTRCNTCTEGKCSRHGGPLGSSGWEHVFSGEWRRNIVDGHHNWVRYFLQEKAGEIEYHGYYAKPRGGEHFVGTIQYKWKQYLKRIGGFMIGTSPAFDFSLFTVCFLTDPGDRKCTFHLKGTPMFVSSALEGCVIGESFRHNFCIATTYPGILPSKGK